VSYIVLKDINAVIVVVKYIHSLGVLWSAKLRGIHTLDDGVFIWSQIIL